MSDQQEGLSPRDYQLAMDVQDACNLSGVVHTFSRVMTKIGVEADGLGEGTEWKNSHPIAVLYASKILSLTGGQGVDGLAHFSKAWDACVEAAE